MYQQMPVEEGTTPWEEDVPSPGSVPPVPPNGRYTFKFIISNIAQFARRPTPERWTHKDALRWFPALLWANLIASTIALPISTAVSAILHTHHISEKESFTKHIWLAVLLAPVLEELIFRLPMRFGKLRITASLPLFVFFVGIVSGIHGPILLWLVSVAFLISALSYTLMRNPQREEQVRAAWHRAFPYLVWSLTLLFGAMHATNFDFPKHNTYLILLAPLLGLPQILTGWILAFTRVRFGLLWSLALHASFNGSLILLMLLLK